MKPSQLIKIMDKNIAELVNDASQYENIREMWVTFFDNHRKYKRVRDELMDYFDRKTIEYSRQSFNSEVRDNAERYYRDNKLF